MRQQDSLTMVSYHRAEQLVYMKPLEAAESVYAMVVCSMCIISGGSLLKEVIVITQYAQFYNIFANMQQSDCIP